MVFTFDPFNGNGAKSSGGDHKKRAFLIGKGPGQVHFLAKMVLYRGQSINCYHLITGERRKLEGRSMPSFAAIRDEFIKTGIEVSYPSDIPEKAVDRWVEYGRAEAEKRGFEIRE